ncbi:hypothetical protein D8674_020129 [Pyrus ussuriensis x Pyrus communis]|uniref:Uncharacterized protein n=1 Tax=Pyrus ussuriensis x Pyrus communis TaxID=2448454 RepID=A0A5N5HK00_9ROSA|nr:hypothetical protein D8674_020129 [Pyrus ussuriensis x Pyrus communis]
MGEEQRRSGRKENRKSANEGKPEKTQERWSKMRKIRKEGRKGGCLRHPSQRLGSTSKLLGEEDQHIRLAVKKEGDGERDGMDRTVEVGGGGRFTGWTRLDGL